MGEKDRECLFELLMNASGLEKKELENELSSIMDEHSMDKNNLSEDNLRTLMLAYLEKLNEEIQAKEMLPQA